MSLLAETKRRVIPATNLNSSQNKQRFSKTNREHVSVFPLSCRNINGSLEEQEKLRDNESIGDCFHSFFAFLFSITACVFYFFQ